MKLKPVVWIVGGAILIIAAMIALAVLLVPENTHPAYAAATDFMNAAGKGEEAAASALLSDELQSFVQTNCPQGQVSACLDAYTPPEWGDLLSAVYRRSIPDGRAWDVLLVATYEEGKGFAGVCIYHRMEEVAPGDWRVAAWSGFIPCDDPDSGLQGLRREDAPNRAP